MGYGRAHATATRERIVKVAARRFRELGLDGIGLADIMGEAGLTVGGFYKHFPSREALVMEALREAFRDVDAGETAASGLAVTLDGYLSTRHRDDPGTGSAIGALMVDIGRPGPSSTPAVRRLFTAQVRRSIADLETQIAGRAGEGGTDRAKLVICAMLGAIGLARAVADEQLSRDLLRSVAAQLIDLAGTEAPARSRTVRRRR